LARRGGKTERMGHSSRSQRDRYKAPTNTFRRENKGRTIKSRQDGSVGKTVHHRREKGRRIAETAANRKSVSGK